jgi:hypothetical protein
MGGHTICDSVKPTRQRLLLTDGAGLPHKEHEGGLEYVLGVVDMPQRAAGDTQDHWSVPPQERFKRRMVTLEEGPQQSIVGFFIALPVRGQAPDVPKDYPDLCGGHRYLSPQTPVWSV